MFLVLATSALVVLGLVAPAAAQDVERPTNAETVRVRRDVRPHVRPDVRPDIVVLSLGCDARRDDTGNLGAACRWSTTDTARGYQLWRIVDRGHRELIGTYNAETNVARDDAPDDAHLVRYAVLALDADGDIIGRSRVVPVRFRQVDTPDVDVRPIETVERPAKVRVRRPIHLLPV